jgi:hypothetical protein
VGRTARGPQRCVRERMNDLHQPCNIPTTLDAKHTIGFLCSSLRNERRGLTLNCPQAAR